MPTKIEPSNLSLAVKEKYIDDLSKYTKVQLLEMKERQLKLLTQK